MTLYVGIDPGHLAGAVVLLEEDGRTVRAAGTYRRRARKVPCYAYDLVVPGDRDMDEVRTLAQIASRWGAGMSDHILTTERLFAPPRHGSSALTLAEACGEFAGPFRVSAIAEYRPLAVQWRSELLRIPTRTPAKAAAAWAEKACVAAFAWPSSAHINEHVAEAAWLARYGWVHHNLPSARS